MERSLGNKAVEAVILRFGNLSPQFVLVLLSAILCIGRRLLPTFDLHVMLPVMAICEKGSVETCSNRSKPAPVHLRLLPPTRS